MFAGSVGGDVRAGGGGGFRGSLLFMVKVVVLVRVMDGFSCGDVLVIVRSTNGIYRDK